MVNGFYRHLKSYHYINQLKLDFLNTIPNLGIDSDTSASDLIRIKLNNQIASIGIVLAVFNTIGNIIHFAIPDIVSGVIVISALSIVLFLSSIKKHCAASVWLLLCITPMLGLIQVLFGKEVRLEAMFLVFVVSSIVSFNGRARFLSVGFVLVAYMVSQYLTIVITPPFADTVNSFANVNYFVFSVLCLSWIVSTLLKLHYSQSIELTKHSDNLQSLVHNTAHKLRTPVHNVINLNQLIRRKVNRPIYHGEVDDCLDIIDNSANDLLEIIDDLREGAESKMHT